MVGPFNSQAERDEAAAMATKIDLTTGRPLGNHGTAEQAIEYALHHAGVCSMEIETFLRQWEQGNLDEWPEYYIWLDEQEREDIEMEKIIEAAKLLSWARTGLSKGVLKAHDAYVSLYNPDRRMAPSFYVGAAMSAVFVKDAETFAKQGGLDADWGMHWIPVIAKTQGDARRIGYNIFELTPAPIYNGEI